MRTVYPRKKGGELELADREVEPGAADSGLYHLLQRRFAAANGEKLEWDSPGLRRHFSPCHRGNRKIVRHRRRHRSLGGGTGAIEIALDQFTPIDSLTERAPDGQAVGRWRSGGEYGAVGHEQGVAHNRQTVIHADGIR